MFLKAGEIINVFSLIFFPKLLMLSESIFQLYLKSSHIDFMVNVTKFF